jgi:hypothetical protein
LRLIHEAGAAVLNGDIIRSVHDIHLEPFGHGCLLSELYNPGLGLRMQGVLTLLVLASRGDLRSAAAASDYYLDL